LEEERILLLLGKKISSDECKTTTTMTSTSGSVICLETSNVVLLCRRYTPQTKSFTPYVCFGRLGYRSHIRSCRRYFLSTSNPMCDSLGCGFESPFFCHTRRIQHPTTMTKATSHTTTLHQRIRIQNYLETVVNRRCPQNVDRGGLVGKKEFCSCSTSELHPFSPS
jgi:hypothetical protein